ncbi:hypothetical protein [Bradyrhizobium embrapense]|uniref:hypothetical protein n=1 Tax=Bradyrhizobium embrapense TaxID=630921 RepID=UPI000AA35579|nr:hypothetical protein [Bradyrhizobium embrapense]
MSKDAAVVPAHGAWADGSRWARVITALDAVGISAVAAPLVTNVIRGPASASSTQTKS